MKEKELNATIEQLNQVIASIVEVYKPEIYDTNKNILNKPMADIPAGHILNVNWDNICNSFKILTEVTLESIKQLEIVSNRCPYEIGDLLITSANSNPGTRWPGTTWTKITQGFIKPTVDNQNPNIVGGTDTFTISKDNLPNISLNVGGLTDTRWGFSPSTQQWGEQFKSGKGGNLWRLKTEPLGKGQRISFTPKFITKHVWERVS